MAHVVHGTGGMTRQVVKRAAQAAHSGKQRSTARFADYLQPQAVSRRRCFRSRSSSAP
jgi:hypothetical protein